MMDWVRVPSIPLKCKIQIINFVKFDYWGFFMLIFRQNTQGGSRFYAKFCQKMPNSDQFYCK
jgi:hypothetical protein